MLPFNQLPPHFSPNPLQNGPATQEFMLIDGVGSRVVQLYQKEVGHPIIVLLDGMTIGSVQSPQEFLYGREISLLDGSSLKIQLVNNHVQVSRNGQVLPALPPPAPPAVFPGLYPVAQPGYPVYDASTKESGKGLAIAGFVLGVVSLIVNITIILWFVGAPAAIVGIILSSLGIRAVSRRTLAIWGLVLSIVAVSIPLFTFIILFINALATRH